LPKPPGVFFEEWDDPLISMLTLTAIGGALAVSAIGSAPGSVSLRQLHLTRRLVLLTDSSSGCSARALAVDVRFDRDRGIDDKDRVTRHRTRLSPCGNMCSS
jgi:hypothetical protein